MTLKRKKGKCKSCGKEKLIYAKGRCNICYWNDKKSNSVKRKTPKKSKKRRSKPKAFSDSERSKLIRRLDSVFSELRKLESLKYNKKLDCFTCGAELSLEEAQLGHWRRRRHLGTRWFKPNGNIQCNQCNVELDGNEDEHEKRIKEVYGEDVLNDIVERSRTAKITNEELEELLEELNKQLQKLKS